MVYKGYDYQCWVCGVLLIEELAVAHIISGDLLLALVDLASITYLCI